MGSRQTIYHVYPIFQTNTYLPTPCKSASFFKRARFCVPRFPIPAYQSHQMLLAQATARNCSVLYHIRTTTYFTEQNKSLDSRGIFHEQKRRIATVQQHRVIMFSSSASFSSMGFILPTTGGELFSTDTYISRRPLYYWSTKIIGPKKISYLLTVIFPRDHFICVTRFIRIRDERRGYAKIGLINWILIIS